MTSEPAIILPWDSEFFGYRIGRAQSSRLTAPEMDALLGWCARERIDCLYLLADAADIPTIRLAEQHRFSLVDIRMTLEISLDGREALPAEATPIVRPATEADLPALKRIARESHRNTRFHADPRFGAQAAERLYETWIENSVHGFAQHVLVATHDGHAAGYTTCHLTSAEGVLGLVGVGSDAQGQGLGTLLVNSALNWLAQQGAAQARVTTHGHNIGAQRLYQRAGFITHSVHIWYHNWPTDW